MPRSPSLQPTDGELDILRILWACGPIALSALCEELRKLRPVAPTTVATMLRVMAGKKLVKRTGSGRGAVWSALVTQAKTERGMVRRLVERVFDGSADRLVAHLVEGGELSADQLSSLRKLVEARSRALPSGRRK
jgi:predicted transcriptional regulator